MMNTDNFNRNFLSGLDARHKNFCRTKLRAESNLSSRFNKSTRRANHPKSPSSPCGKNILIFRNGKSVYISSHPVPLRGAFRERHGRGAGCGGRGGARDGRCRSVRPSRMVLTPPTKVSSLRSLPQATVAMSRAHRGDHEATVRPLRRESRMSPLDLYARVRFLPLYCTRDRGCSAHPAFPALSDWRGRDVDGKPRANCAARSRRCVFQPSSRHSAASCSALISSICSAKRLR